MAVQQYVLAFSDHNLVYFDLKNNNKNSTVMYKNK